MTEETNTQPNQGVNISVEQILAAVISTVGTTTVPLEKLVENYSSKTIAVTQNEDKSVVFALVDAPQTEEVEESAE